MYSIEKAFEIRKLAHSNGESYGNHVDVVGKEIIQRVKNLNGNLPVFFNDLVKSVKRSLDQFEEINQKGNLTFLQ